MFEDLEQLKGFVKKCERCRLCKTRKNVVFGEGNPNATLMFIGEASNSEEDELGKLFIGKTGDLFKNALDIVDIKKEEIYLTNVVKCKSLYNKHPLSNEIYTCLNFLRNEVIIVKPKIIVLMGQVPLQSILGTEYKLSVCRGQWFEKKGILYMPTWNPSMLLTDEIKKIDFLSDLKLVSDKYNSL